MNLTEWSLNFINCMNSFKKNLDKININKNEIHCYFHEKRLFIYIVIETLNENFFYYLNLYKNENLIFVCLNKKDNLNFLIDNWQELIKKKDLKFIFVNIDENLYWVLIPYYHNIISDNLRLGLKALFESIPMIK